jgi:hypothetical protein
MYFPTFEQLLLDATVGALSQASVERALENVDAAPVDERLRRLVQALMSTTPEIERLGRALIRLTVESPADSGTERVPRRGYRRIELLEAAVDPLRTDLGQAGFRRLVNALAMVVGWEALIVQRDVCGLTADEGAALSEWAAAALLRAARADVK